MRTNRQVHDSLTVEGKRDRITATFLVAIVRGSLTEPKIAVVDYKEIVKGKAPDVLLEPGDIVYVPFSPYRTLVKYADLILKTFVQTVAINEGARAGHWGLPGVRERAKLAFGR